jgi:hypothetical protein
VTPDAAVVAVIDALEAAGIPYMLVGSLASNVHGIPRSTQDADLVIDVAPDRLTDLARVLPAPLSLDDQSAFEGVTGTTRHVIRLAGSAFVCELFHLSDDPHDQDRFKRRKSIPALGRHPWIATAEDMIVTKLRWSLEAGRVKDREDIRNIIAVRGTRLDWPYIEHWSERHGTRGLLDELRRSVPPVSR